MRVHFISKSILRRLHPFLQSLLVSNQCISLSVYGFVRLLFYQYPITFAEELTLLLQASGWGVITALFLYSFYHVYASGKKLQGRKLALLPIRMIALALVLSGSVVLLSSCELQGASVETNMGKKERRGIKRDNTTGLQVTYNNLEPENICLVMNGEELHHTDIPLGETFTILNKDVSGLTQKEGRVSVGCALRIVDRTGKPLLEADDLFKENGVFDAAQAANLKCKVSTGSPMQWDEAYDVQATFWDKYGSGRMTNTVTIHTIDVP